MGNTLQRRCSSSRAYVAGPADVKIVENRPAKVSLQVTRSTAGSTFTQVISLTAGDDSQRVDVNNVVNWNTKATNLKVAFPLSVQIQWQLMTLDLEQSKRK